MHVRPREFTFALLRIHASRTEWTTMSVAAAVAEQAYFPSICHRTRNLLGVSLQCIIVICVQNIIMTKATISPVFTPVRGKVEQGARWGIVRAEGNIRIYTSLLRLDVYGSVITILFRLTALVVIVSDCRNRSSTLNYIPVADGPAASYFAESYTLLLPFRRRSRATRGC